MNPRQRIEMDESAVALLRRGLYAASRDADRPILCAGYFDADRVVCTDAYRMSIAYFDGRPLPRGLLIDAAQLKKLLPRRGDWSTTVAELRNEIATRPAYPDYRRVLRAIHRGFSYSFPRAALAEELSAMPRRRKDEVIVAALRPRLALSNRIRYGEQPTMWMHSPIPSVTDPGRERAVPVYVDAYFLRDLVNACTADRVAFECQTALKGVMVRQPGMTHLLMPMRYEGPEPT